MSCLPTCFAGKCKAWHLPAKARTRLIIYFSFLVRLKNCYKLLDTLTSLGDGVRKKSLYVPPKEARKDKNKFFEELY